MVKAISAWRMARSFIGNAATEETVELDFNIGTREAIEIASVQGIMNATTMASAASIGPIHAEQSLHLEDGTIEALNSSADEADQFENDSEVIYQQTLNAIAFDGTTEGGVTIDVHPNGNLVYARPFLSPINPTHRSDMDAAAMDIGCILLIQYRYVELSDSELALEFARRRR